MTAFDEVAAIAPHRIWDGVLGRVVHGERVTLAVVELEPDTVIPEHSHENEQVGVLVRGSVTFRVGDETRELEPGGTWRIPTNVPHDVATGPEGAVVVEVFAPARADWDALERREPHAPQWPDAA
jgi:quercetin dioxygenase-like cupin family protein